MIVAGLALFGAFLYFVKYPGTGIGFGMSLMPLMIIWYLNSAEVKSAFGLDTRRPPDHRATAVSPLPQDAPARFPDWGVRLGHGRPSRPWRYHQVDDCQEPTASVDTTICHRRRER